MPLQDPTIDVRTLPDSELDNLAVVVVSRLVITGSNHHRLHEELTVSGGYLKDEGFSREPKVIYLAQGSYKARQIGDGVKLVLTLGSAYVCGRFP